VNSSLGDGFGCFHMQPFGDGLCAGVAVNEFTKDDELKCVMYCGKRFLAYQANT
jgi:hypothetical protein